MDGFEKFRLDEQRCDIAPYKAPFSKSAPQTPLLTPDIVHVDQGGPFITIRILGFEFCWRAIPLALLMNLEAI